MNRFPDSSLASALQVPQLLFHIQEPECNGYDFHYHQPARPVYVIGRDGLAPDPDGVRIGLQDDQVSRNHCRIFLDPAGSWMIEDLGSTNGTLLRGEPEPAGWQPVVTATPLPSNCDIRVGETLLTLTPLAGQAARWTQ
ncbi:MAG: FHA domain-containing protein [Magnetococcales bacterium]|nr:FHA domain-containing protein [Magnetococcales bacterium]